jgi:phospholipid/cholesterol/gamma-HCH transport system ATP-binding protein
MNPMATPTPTTSLVEFRNLSFSYDTHAVLENVSLRIPRGKVTAVIGPMGAGKTTALRLMGGEQHAQSGEMLFDGQNIGTMDHQQLYTARRRMGMLFQFGALFADLNVFENVAFPLREHTDLADPLIRDIVLMKLNAVGLRGARYLMPSEVSGGMARRIAIARAIALDPELIMYDEPFSGLDPISLKTAAQLIRKLNDSMGLTSVFVSHELKQTLEISDHVIVLANGRVALEGTPDEVRNSKDPMVDQYVHSRPDGPVHFHFPGLPIEQDFALPA